MPEAEKAEKKPTLPPLPSQIVKRNDVEWNLDTFQIVKGKNEGTQYLSPKVTIENIEDYVKWLGAPNVVNVLQTWTKRTAWSIWVDNINTDGSFNMIGFLKGMEEITSAGMKLKEIRDKMDELQAQISNILDKGDVGTNPDGTPSADLLRVKELNTEYRAYKDMEEKRSKKGAPEVEDEPAVVTS